MKTVGDAEAFMCSERGRRAKSKKNETSGGTRAAKVGGSPLPSSEAMDIDVKTGIMCLYRGRLGRPGQL